MTKEAHSRTISDLLERWYLTHKRDLPWRETKDPYAIWLSEVIMQQTRVEQGTPYWYRFMQLFPDVDALAAADEDEVLKAWEGLGYYSRARNLHKAAKWVSGESSGVFPTDYKGLLALPGVGPYIAAAVASICYGEAVAVVDGNVYRLLSRLYGISTEINTGKAHREFAAIGSRLLVGKDPGTINQAMMEYGARLCTYRQPKCGECVLSAHCHAHAQDLIEVLPVKKAKKAVRERTLNYHVLLHQGHTYIQQRGAGDVWEGLYEFVLDEAPLYTDPQLMGPADRLVAVRDAKHILSHQRILARFFIIDCEEAPRLGGEVKRVPISKLGDYAFARLTTRFLEENAWLMGGA